MKCIGAALPVVSFAAVVWSRHTTPSISRLRGSASRDETKKRVAKETTLIAGPPIERKSKLFVYS